MPSNWQTIDANFPTFTGEESPQQQIQALHNYLYQLREGLQYSLQNLTTDNFNATALQNLNEAQRDQVGTALQKIYALLNQMSAELKRLSSRVSDVEDKAGEVVEVVQVEEDGSATIGSEGKPLHLVGQIYINGVLYEQGGTT